MEHCLDNSDKETTYFSSYGKQGEAVFIVFFSFSISWFLEWNDGTRLQMFESSIGEKGV